MNKTLKIIRAILLANGFMVAIASSAMASPIPFSSYTNQESRADVIGWEYKTINGKLYKRLYNYTTKEWIGDWILCE